MVSNWSISHSNLLRCSIDEQALKAEIQFHSVRSSTNCQRTIHESSKEEDGYMQKPVLGTRNLHEAVEQLGQFAGGLDSATYADLLKECGNAKALAQGKQVHAHISKCGLDRDTFLGNHLVHMYGKCGSLENACRAFDNIRQRNVFSCNIMIAAYTENGNLQEAKSLFDETLQKNTVTWNAMIAAYAQKGHVQAAQIMFDKMPQKDVISWSAMVATYAQNGHGRKSLQMFRLMDLEGVKPNRVTYMSILDACADLGALEEGMIIHACIAENGLQSEVKLGNSLVHMYGSCGRIQEARNIFEAMPERSIVTWNSMIAAYAQSGHLQEAKNMFGRMPLRDIVSWNAMIAAYVQNGHSSQALELYDAMDLKPDEITFVSVVDACANLTALPEGKAVHGRLVASGFNTDLKVSNALLNMYAKCECLEDAKAIFDSIQHRNVVSWTAMITAYIQTGHGKEALQIFRRMDLEGVKPDNYAFVSALDACALASGLEEGKAICARAIANGYFSETPLGNALINLYGKCGSLDDARQAFDNMPRKDALSLNAMISVYAANGLGSEAVELLKAMVLDGVNPDGITFMSIFSACSHAGLLDVAWHYFPCMRGDYGVTPTMDHYVSMLDLIARAGLLERALDLVNNMPFEPPAVAWTILLGACNTHGEVSGGANAAERVIHLEPGNSAPYILLSNMQ